MHKHLFWFCFAVATSALSTATLFSHPIQEDAEGQQAASAAKKFLSILEKNPQRGIALEKVFSFHLQHGSLDDFVADLQKRVQSDPSDGAKWMMIGLFESLRRQDQPAILAFQRAETLRPTDSLPAYYRGQCLLRIGEPDKAVQAIEEAIARKPARALLLEIFELLGRTHQRQNRNDLALDCWKRLEGAFPDDLRVLEQIATVQNQEGAYQDALSRYERLIPLSKDAYQRIRFRIEATQLRIRLGDNARGLTELEAILADLQPDGWLYRDVQRKIEEVYLKPNDQSGLIAHYENRLTKFPDDIESMVRLAKFLNASNRVDEANRWMQHAIARAPSRLELKREYIDHLITGQQISAAAQQFGELSKLDPSNSDVLREWGKLVLRDPSLSAEEAKDEASRIWMLMLTSRADDALTRIQLADLFQSAQMPTEAQKHFERAIELAPEDGQYREYFGDFLYKQDRLDEAFEAWDKIAEGERRNAVSVMRLAEIYHHAKQHTKAAKLAQEACGLAPRDPLVYMRTARIQSSASQFDEALESLVRAEKLADNDDQRESIVQEHLSVLVKSGRLESEAEKLRLLLSNSKSPSIASQQLLARYLVRLQSWKDARGVVDEVLRRDGSNLAMLHASSDVAEGLRDSALAIQSLRKLADVDRRRRQEYLQRIARLEIQKKNWIKAIETAAEVVQAVPSKLEGYEFMAQICFQAKNPALGIETLRKALRIDPNANRLILALGNALADQKKFSEAIELCWQLFAKTSSLDEKIELTTKLVRLYKQQSSTAKRGASPNPLSQLIDRLQELRKDAAQRRDCTICLSQVYQSSSDFAKAKSILAELLLDRAQDANILKQLARLSLDSGDLEMAIDYQKQLVAFAPGQENESSLANLLRQHGDWSEANRIVLKLLQNERDPLTTLQNVDTLLDQGECDLALQTLEPMLKKEPNDWELMYRKGMALTGIDRWQEALVAFESVLALENDSTQRGFFRATSNPKKKRTVLSPATNHTTSTLQEIERMEFIDIATGRGKYASGDETGNRGTRWAPETFGQVRLACMAWLVNCESKDPDAKSTWLANTSTQATSNASRAMLLDAIAIAKYRQDSESQISMLATLAASGEPEMQTSFLQCLRRRQVSGNPSENKNRRPLSGSQINLLLEAYEATTFEPVTLPPPSPASGLTPIARQQMLLANLNTNRNRTNLAMAMQQLATQSNAKAIDRSRPKGNEGYLRTVMNELRFAGEAEQAELFLTRQIQTAHTEFKLQSLCEYLLMSERYEDVEQPLLRWFAAYQDLIQEGTTVSNPATYGTVTAPPTEFAIRFLDSIKEQAVPDAMIRLMDAAMNLSNEMIRKGVFKPATAAELQTTHETVPKQGLAKRTIQVPTWSIRFLPGELFVFIHSAKDLFRQSNRTQEWTDYFNHRVAKADDSRPLESLRQAIFVDEQVEPDNKTRAIATALQQIGTQPGCELTASAALLARQNYKESLGIAQAFHPTDSQEELLRELIVLHASAATSDLKQLDTSVGFLSNRNVDQVVLSRVYTSLQKANARNLIQRLQLSQNVSSPNAIVMPRVSANSPTASVNSRIRLNPSYTAPRIPSSSQTEHAMYVELSEKQKSGQIQEAVNIARKIVSKPRVFQPSGTPIWNFVPNNANGMSATSPRTMRNIAFFLLKENGELTKLIAETESALSEAPNSFLHRELLAEYYEFDRNFVRANEITRSALNLRPSSNLLRIHFAERLQASGDHSGACDQYLELIRRSPNLGISMTEQLIPVFALAGRSTELVKAIRETNFHSIAQREQLIEQAKALLRTVRSYDAGATMLEKLWNLDSTFRKQVFLQLYETPEAGHGNTIPVYPDLFPFTLAGIIPNENEVFIDAWYGFEEEGIELRAGKESYLFERLIQRHKSTDVEWIKSAIESAVDRMPSWNAGHVMLAMIASKATGQEIGSPMLTALANNRRLLEDCPEGLAFRIAQLFLLQSGTQQLGYQMLESLVGSDRFLHLNLEDRPIMILAKHWVANGERVKAMEVITKEAANDTGFQDRRMVINSQGGPNRSRSLGYHVLDLGMPVDSYRLFNLHKNPAQRFRDLALRVTTVALNEAGKKATIQAIDRLSPEQAIDECLQDRTNATTGMPAVELMFQVPKLKEIATQRIESEVQAVLLRHSEPGHRNEIERRLERLAVLHPKDITVLATQSRFRMATGIGNVEATLAELERSLSEASSNPGIENLFSTATVWLVARQCYSTGKHLDVAERLATHALKAVKAIDEIERSYVNNFQNSNSNESSVASDFANIMLFEWGRSQLQSGLADKGMATWQELIDNVCSDQPRSTQRKPNSTPLASRDAQRTWTKSQFDWLMFLANVAVDEKEVSCSKSILGEAVKRRLPSVNSTRAGMENATKPSVRAIEKLVKRWGADGASPSELYDLLLPFFLPGDREIYLYMEEARLLDEKPVFLASSLIDAAVRAGREKDLLDRVVQRDAHAKKMVSLVFRTHLAMAKKDFPETKKLLEECREQFDAEVPRWDIEAACYAAIPAFEIEELREAALPILEAFLEQEKTTGIYPASDLQLFKLSREIQAYLDEKKTR